MPVAGKKAKRSKAAALGAPATSKSTSASTSKQAASTSATSRPTSVATSKPASDRDAVTGVKTTSTGAKATSVKPGASPTVPCAVCEQDILDGKDQALFCEGLCQRWFHRYCAGVSVLHFDVLSSSSEPFHCASCFQKYCTTEMANLTKTIYQQFAVSELRETLVGISSPATNLNHQHSSFADDRCAQRSVLSGVCGDEGRSGQVRGVRGGRVGGRKGRWEKRNEVGILGEMVEEVISGNGSGGAGVEDTSSDSQKKRPAEKVRVQGARRVWGTLKLTTPSSLKSAIFKFCPANSIQIKRKTVCDKGGQVKRWWFVVHAPEEVLVTLDAAWEQLKLQTGWKLEPCFKPSFHTVPDSPSPTPQPTSPCPTSQPTSPCPTSQPTSPCPTSQPTSPCPTLQPTSDPTEGSHNNISHEQNICDSNGQSPSHTPFRSTPFLEN